MGYWGLSRGFERWVYEARLAGSAPGRPTGSDKALTRNKDPGDADTAVRLLVRLPVFQAGQRGSKPLRATDEHPRSVPVRTRLCEGRRSGSIPDGDTD